MNTTTWKNRTLSVVLTVIMVFSMLPLSVFAAGGAVAEVTVNGNTTQYTDIDKAFAAAQEASSATVKLLADVTINHANDTYGIELEKGNITLDLNGKTISQKSGIPSNRFYPLSAVFYLALPQVSSAEDFSASLQATTRLTVQDSSADGNGKIVQPNGGPAIIATLNTTLTVNGGTIETTSSDDYDNDQHTTPNCAVLLSGGGKAVINGGTLSGVRGLAVTGYITKEEEGIYKDLGIEGFNNDTYGNELTVTDGEISGTDGEALIVYEKAKKIELSGGKFTTRSNEHSIWVDDTEEDGEPTIKGDAASLLVSGYRYEYNGKECAYSEDGKGVKGNATVALRPANEYAYIDKDGKLTTQANCTEITESTDDISTPGWYVLNKDITISTLNISGEVNLILCDGATLTVTRFMNVAAGSTLNFYWQSAGSGKLTAANIGGKGSVTAPAGEMKKTTGEDGTTYEKCLTHEWQYTVNEDGTHTATCTLCGKDGGTVAHEFNNLESTTEATHTYSCVCGKTKTDNHPSLSESPNADGLTHTGRCGICGYSTAPEKHEFKYSGMCSCSAYLTATSGGQSYASLASAVAAAAKIGGTVTLQKAVAENIIITDGMNVTVDLNNNEWTHTNENGNRPALTVNGGSVTVKNGTIRTGEMSGAYHPVEINGGRLTVGESMTIQASDSGAQSNPAIEMTDGELTLSVGTKLVCGIRVPKGKQLKDYLPAGTAFQQTDYNQGATTGTDRIVNGYVQEYVGKFTLTVVEHKAHSYTDGVCDCGFVCEHTGGTASYFQKKVCTICGAEYGDLLEDTTAPTGSITIKERTPFQTFIKTITFGLFFKEDVTATVTAEDDSYEQAGYDKSKHAVRIEYLVSDQAFTEEDLKAQTFTEYSKAIDLTDEQNYVVYAHLTDHAGNETYLSTDGFVIDRTAPSINDFADGQKVHICGTSYTVSIKDANLDTVTLDGKKQSGDTIQFRYNYNGVEEHTVVAKDWAGNTSTVTFFQHQAHDFDSETCVCKNKCGTAAAAKVQIGDEEASLYGTFDEAWYSILRVTKPIKLTLLADADINGSVSLGDFDLTVVLNGYTFGHTGQEFLLKEGNNAGTSKLIVTGAGRFLSSILVGTNGHLTVEADVDYISGVKISFNKNGEEDSPTNWSVALKGGKYGELDMRYADKDGVTVVAAACGELAAPGYVFDRDDEVSSEAHATNVTVIPCPNHEWIDGVCDNCNLPCPHDWTDNKCTVCGYVCSHSSVEERNGNTYCSEMCGQQMVVKVEKDDSTAYYAKLFDSRGSHPENTLNEVFDKAEHASTVTLLADDLIASGWITGKNIMLNLNGKKLIENNGIVVDMDDTNTAGKLFVYGEGSSGAPEGISYPCTFRVLNDSELVLNENFSGDYGTIYLENGVLTSNSANVKIRALVIQNSNAQVKLKGGKFGKIVTEGSVTRTASSLLERRYAFQKADGSYVPYDTEISQASSLENVTVVKCDHKMTEMPTGNQYNRLKCPNCDEALEAVLKTADGKINGYKDLTDSFGRTGALSVAETTPGCTVTMYYDAEHLNISTGEAGFTLDANDCDITQLTLHEGTLTVKNATIKECEHNFGHAVSTYSDVFGTFATTLTLENCVVQRLEESTVATLSVSGSLTLKNTVVNGNTSVTYMYSITNEGLTVEESELNGEVTVRGSLTFKSGNASTSKITVYGVAEISDGIIHELDYSGEGGLTVSGGQFGKITVPDETQLIDCLKDGYAFRYNNVRLADGRSSTLEGVYVAEHTHGDYKWDTATHEKVCACGDVKETDTAAPTFDGIVTGEIYYQNILTFTVEDAVSGIKEVKDGDTVLIAENGNYTVTADNKVHTITATDNAGNTATVTVTVYKVYNATLEDGEGYSIDGESTIGYNQGYTFTVTIAEGYSRVKGSYKVLVNGKEVTAGSSDKNSDRFKVIALGNLTIIVEGVADITAPEAEMTIGESKFKSFLNTITFGLFFKKTQTVTVTADDAGSRVAKAEYLLSETAFATGKDVTGDWTEFNLNNGTGSFSIAPNAKGSVYVRVTDNAGNYTVINSEGVVVYTDSEASTNSIEFTRLSKTDVTVTVDFKGNTVKSVFCDGIELNGTSYNVLYPSADSGSTYGTIELRNMFLGNLAAGEHTITVEYNPMGETYKEAEGNEAPDFTEVMLTVVKAERTLTFDAPDAEYDGEAYDDLRITDKPGRTSVHYKEQGAEDSTYDTTAPKNAGNYTVKITVDADEDYKAKTITKDFTISPKKVTIKDVVVKAVKEYDGSAAAEDMTIAAAYIDGKCMGDDLTIDITGAEANFSDQNVGVGKTVTFSGFKLGGSAKDNYKLTAQPISVRADITAKYLTVENLKIKTKKYDDTNAAEIDGTPTLNGVVDGDTLTLVNGTPVFDSTAVGEDIAIKFTTPFALAGDEVTVKNYTLTQPTGITGNIVAWIADGSEYSVNSKDWINTDFTVTAKTGYQLSRTDTAVGDWKNELTASKETADGKLTFYVKSTATGAISTAITVNYKIDKTAPTGAITLNERTPFQKFLNTITFDLFFKDNVTVKLTASDDASGVKSVEYYQSDKAMTLEDIKAVTDWTTGKSFGITAEDMVQFVTYARITDKAGNVTYISSDGAEFDTTAPEIVGVENGKTYYVTRRVAADDKNLASVKVNRETKNVDSFFELAGDTDTAYTIVATDKAGNVTTVTVTMKPISAITDAIKDITVDNVTSADADTIDQVAQQILDVAAESDEDVIGAEQWNKLTEAAANCKKLQTRIAEVSAEIDRLTDAVNSYDIDKVTSADKADIEQLITDIDVLLATDNLTDAERAALEALKETAQALLDRIAATKSAAEADEIAAVKDITKDNVPLDDKDDLLKSEKALEKALDDFDGNYTDDERKALNDKLDTIKAALDAIENAEKAAEEIEKLPSADNVKFSDKDEVERVSKIIDTLTENEKAMLGEKAIGKLKALNDKLTALAADKPTYPGTGDTSDLVLWIALLFISGGVITGVTVAGKKKKQQDR